MMRARRGAGRPRSSSVVAEVATGSRGRALPPEVERGTVMAAAAVVVVEAVVVEAVGLEALRSLPHGG